MKIFHITMTSFILVILILMTITLVGFNFFFQEQLSSQVIDHLEDTATSRAFHIETHLTQQIELLESITSRNLLRETIKKYNDNPSEEYLETITRIIVDAKRPMDGFERICVISLEGEVISSTNDYFLGRNVKDKDFFINGLNEGSVNFVEEDGIVKIFVSGPFIINGETVGVGITVVRIDFLKEIARNRVGLKNTGEVVLAIQGENERIYLYERLFEESALPQELEGEETALPMKEALNRNETIFYGYLDYRNKNVVAVSRFIELGQIGLVAKIDFEEAIEQPFYVLQEFLAVTFIIGLIIFVLVGFVFSKYITNPINKLSSKVERISKGEFDTMLDNSKIYEIQNLTNSLNRILASMKLAILKTNLSKSDIGLKEAIKEREETKEFVNSITMNVPGIIYRCEADKDWTMIFINEQIKKLTGYPKEDFIDNKVRTYASIIHPDDKEFVEKTINTAIKKGVDFNLEYRIIDSQGKIRYVYEKGRINKLIGGKEIIDGAIFDVSDKKDIASFLSIYKKGFETSPNSMVLVQYIKNKPVIINVNKSFTNYYKYTKKEAIGRNPSVLKSGKYSKKYYEKLWKDVLNVRKGYWQGEIINKSKTGKDVKVILIIHTIFDEKNKPIYFVANHVKI